MLRVGNRLFKTNGQTWYEIAWNSNTQRWKACSTVRVVEVRDD
jgi:hypothetical protein